MASAGCDKWKDWLRGDISHAVHNTFGSSGTPTVSVFVTSSDEEEAAIVAANMLTRDWGSSPLGIVRILNTEIQTVNIESKMTPGDTPVAWVNRQHRDLVADAAQFQMLAKDIDQHVCSGQDRVRVFLKQQLGGCFQQFINAGALPGAAQQRARRYLDKAARG